MVIGRDGKPFEGVKIRIVADDPASALQRFRETRLQREFQSSPVFHRDKSRIIEALVRNRVPDAKEGIKVLPTTVDSVYILQKEVDGKVLKGYFNLRTKQFVEPQFNAIFSDDAANGFIRVKTADGKWGVLDSEKGGYHIDPKRSANYSSLQIIDAKSGLFETQVNKSVDGVIKPRLGIIGLNGKEYVKPDYDFIQSPRDGLYRGVNFGNGDDFSQISSVSRELDISRIRAVGMRGDGDHSFGKGISNAAESDPLSTAIA